MINTRRDRGIWIYSRSLAFRFFLVLVTTFVQISVYSDFKSVRVARTLRGFLEVARRRCVRIFRFCTNLCQENDLDFNYTYIHVPIF